MKAYMFPGQGSQAKGMGQDLFEKFPELTKTADEILGYSIKELCLENPNRNLNKTQFTQPAIFVVNALNFYDRLESGQEKPDFLLGHSLGEFNALLAAECFDFATGLTLVKKRGELMSQAKDGAMAAILNSNKEEITQLLADNDLKNIDLANFNTLSQIVISGSLDDIGKAQSVFSFGKVTYHPLNTSGAFHSHLMTESQSQFEDFISTFDFKPPQIPVIANVDAQPYANDKVVRKLSDQMSNGVKWADSVEFLLLQAKQASETLYLEEVGSGSVLTKIGKTLVSELADVYEDVVIGAPPAKKDVEAQTGGEKNSGISEDAQKKVDDWNAKYKPGQKVVSSIADYDELETRTEAMVLFKQRAVIYMQGYHGYFDLDEISAVV